MKPRTLIFLDIDGTLLGPDYRPNSNRIQKLIKKLSRKGYLFCLNSNRAWNDLEPVARMFHINGPIIAENGVYFVFRGKKKFLVKPKLIQPALRKELAKLSKNKKSYVEITDTVHYNWKGLSKTPLAWLANGFRKYTASIHVRTFGKKDSKAAMNLAKLLSERFSGYYTITTSPLFANVLIYPRSTGKGVAIQRLQKEFFPKASIFMIGDDEADLPARVAVDRFYAVGNASPKIKRVADFSAKLPYTRGAVEILNFIDKMDNSG